MKTATNKRNKIVSFPALAIAFGPGESKQVSDEIAAALEGAAFITISGSAKIQPVAKPVAVEEKDKDEESTGKKVEKKITSNESDE